MTKYTKLSNNDNGAVYMVDEAILDGKKPSEPETICTKYPETCTDLIIAHDDCNTGCCMKIPTVDEPECLDDVYCTGTWKIDSDSSWNEAIGLVTHSIRIWNLTDCNLKIKLHIVGTARNYSEISTNGGTLVPPFGGRDFTYEYEMVQPYNLHVLRFKTTQRGKTLTVTPDEIPGVPLDVDSTLTSTDVI